MTNESIYDDEAYIKEMSKKIKTGNYNTGDLESLINMCESLLQERFELRAMTNSKTRLINDLLYTRNSND